MKAICISKYTTKEALENHHILTSRLIVYEFETTVKKYAHPHL